MKCHSKNILLKHSPRRSAFGLMEAIFATAILALICSSVLVVINRCVASAADSTIRMQAFSVARENMEKLLTSQSTKETVEYGNSEIYPQIQWETTVETFYEPITNRMWVQANCSAEYPDTSGETQKIELTSWLTDLTKKQLIEIAKEIAKKKEYLAKHPEVEASELDEPMQPDQPDEPEPDEPEPDEPEPDEPEPEIESPPDADYPNFESMTMEEIMAWVRQAFSR